MPYCMKLGQGCHEYTIDVNRCTLCMVSIRMGKWQIFYANCPQNSSKNDWNLNVMFGEAYVLRCELCRGQPKMVFPKGWNAVPFGVSGCE